MLFSTTPQSPPEYGDKITEILERYDQPSQVRISSPYVTTGGLNNLLLNNSGDDWAEMSKSKWIVGINQGVTSADALRVISTHSDAELRVFLPREKLTESALRKDPYLHAKVLAIKSESNSDQQSLIVTSANITSSAMGNTPRNYELGIHQSYPDSLTVNELDQFHRWWNEVWSQSIKIDEEWIGNYEEIRGEISREIIETPEDSNEYTVEDASDAKYMWTDTGGMQGEERYLLEIKEELAEFFDEKCDSVGNIMIEHRSQKYNRRIKYDEGHYTPQWRVYLPTDFAIHDKSYYRYKTAFFEKKRDENGNRFYRLEISEMDGQEVDVWEKKADESGVQSETAAGAKSRRYGYW